MDILIEGDVLNFCLFDRSAVSLLLLDGKTPIHPSRGRDPHSTPLSLSLSSANTYEVNEESLQAGRRQTSFLNIGGVAV